MIVELVALERLLLAHVVATPVLPTVGEEVCSQLKLEVCAT